MIRFSDIDDQTFIEAVKKSYDLQSVGWNLGYHNVGLYTRMKIAERMIKLNLKYGKCK